MKKMRFSDCIIRKRRGSYLDDEEIQFMIDGFVSGKIPDYQMSAMLMAICFRGMNNREIASLTMAMRDSGDIVDLSAIEGVKVDKHSTGGVGDKTTLVIGPIVASYGIPVAKMSGRGLGFTGGTLDKLEAIPGFNVFLEEEKFFQGVKENNVCVIGQTANLAPADKLLYALRDVTGTVDCIPLIASSIMSKKLACGSDKILLDVTTGTGAFIKNMEDSKELARQMVAIGNAAGKETIAMLTSMDEPLGNAIGNSLEVQEAIETLKGGGPEDLKEVCINLAGMMIYMGVKDSKNKKVECKSFEQGKELASKALENGRAFEYFKKMVKFQGGDLSYIDNPEKFEISKYSKDIIIQEEGYIVKINTEGVGMSAGILGAGRETKESEIDYGAGIIMKKGLGSKVKKGDVFCTIYASSQEKIDRAENFITLCYDVENEYKEPPKLIEGIIQ